MRSRATRPSARFAAPAQTALMRTPERIAQGEARAAVVVDGPAEARGRHQRGARAPAVKAQRAEQRSGRDDQRRARRLARNRCWPNAASASSMVNSTSRFSNSDAVSAGVRDRPKKSSAGAASPPRRRRPEATARRAAAARFLAPAHQQRGAGRAQVEQARQRERPSSRKLRDRRGGAEEQRREQAHGVRAPGVRGSLYSRHDLDRAAARGRHCLGKGRQRSGRGGVPPRSAGQRLPRGEGHRRGRRAAAHRGAGAAR